MKLSCISLAMLPLLSVFSVQAAVYNVVEVGQVDELKSTFAAGINNAGDTVFNGAILTSNSAGQAGMQLFNFPIDLSLIDFENETVQSDTIEALALKTKPPARYSEATLLSAMESAGKWVDDDDMREAMAEKVLALLRPAPPLSKAC